MPIYDISITVSPTMVRWPGDPPVEITAEKAIERDGYALSRISLGSHTGTHLDAPKHLISGGMAADCIPLEVLVGKAYVIEVAPSWGLAIEVGDLAVHGLPREATRILLKTANSHLWGNGPQLFEEHYVYLSRSAAAWLVQRGIKLVGTDYLSVDPFPSEAMPAHHELLKAGVVILEGLNLSQVTSGVYQLIALPLKMAVADGLPVRAILVQ